MLDHYTWLINKGHPLIVHSNKGYPSIDQVSFPAFAHPLLAAFDARI
jgi:hypothetical protein